MQCSVGRGYASSGRLCAERSPLSGAPPVFTAFTARVQRVHRQRAARSRAARTKRPEDVEEQHAHELLAEGADGVERVHASGEVDPAPDDAGEAVLAEEVVAVPHHKVRDQRGHDHAPAAHAGRGEGDAGDANRVD